MPTVVTISQRIRLYLLRLPAGRIVETRRQLLSRGIDVSIDQLSAHAIAGGDVTEVGAALLEAYSLGLPLDFMRACVIDLVRDKNDPDTRPTEVVRLAAEPRAHRLPSVGAFEFSTPGKFTWRVSLIATLKLDLATYVGGAGLPTLEARAKDHLFATYERANDVIAADRALAGSLRDAGEAFTQGTRFKLVSLRRDD